MKNYIVLKVYNEGVAVACESLRKVLLIWREKKNNDFQLSNTYCRTKSL